MLVTRAPYGEGKIKFVKSELNIQDEDKLIAAILKLNEKY